MTLRLGPRTLVRFRGRLCPCRVHRGPNALSEFLLAPSAQADWLVPVVHFPRRTFPGDRAARRPFSSGAPGSTGDDDGEGRKEDGRAPEAEAEADRPAPSSGGGGGGGGSPFPWRHSGDALDRVVAGDDRSGLQISARARFVRKMLVAHELGVGWWSRLTGSWEAELAGNFAWAFRAGLSGLLSCRFGVPLNEINDEDTETVSIDTTSENNAEFGEEEKEVADELAKATVEEELRILYEAVDPTAVKINLKVQPLAWQLENVFLIPLLTREQVHRNPSLRGAYQAIEAEFNKTKSVDTVRKMGEQLAKDSGFSGKRTVIADVSIRCLESFQVFDRGTGDVVQGNASGEEEMVTHLVRFEMVTSKGDGGERVAGTWQIIDWDDLLEGNVWH